jgi:hypothetical protein
MNAVVHSNFQRTFACSNPRQAGELSTCTGLFSVTTKTALKEKSPGWLVPGRVVKAKLLDCTTLYVSDRFCGGIRNQDSLDVPSVDCPVGQERSVNKSEERRPILRPHENDWEILYFASLDQRRDLEEFIQSAEPSRHGDKTVGVFGQHDLANKKISKLNPFIQIRVRLLFLGKGDVAANRSPLGIFRSTVCSLH